MNNKHKGTIAESVFTTEALKRGWTVSLPYGDNARYDVILDRGNGLERLQIKSSTLRNKSIVAYTRSIYNNSKGQQCKTYTAEEIDGFVIYSPELDSLYLVPIEKQEGKKSINLTLESRNPNHPMLNWAKDYTL
jgi:hypothetical protein